MSRNFELLRQVEKKEEELFQNVRAPSPSPDGKKGKLDLESLASEEIVKLVRQVFLVPGSESGTRVVLFSGVEHGDGCTWTCACAAEALAAQCKGSVCAVDANFRSPSLHKVFGVDNLRGLAGAVAQPGHAREFAQKVGAGDLFLVSCGLAAADPRGWLALDGLRSRVAELRTEFDYLLIDAPPVVLYADALALAQVVDGVILVLGANTTRREAARKAKESLEAANVRLLGAVLNRRTFPIPGALYRQL